MKPFRPSVTARRVVAQNPTPLRARFATNGGLVPMVERAPLRAPAEEWVLCLDGGEPRRHRSDLSDLLAETPRSIKRMLDPLPVHVFLERPESLIPQAQDLLDRVGPDAAFPRVLVVPAGVAIGAYADESEWLNRHGFVVVRQNSGEVARLAARLPQNRANR